MTNRQTRWRCTIAIFLAVIGIGIWLGEDLSSAISAGALSLLLIGGLAGYLIAPYATPTGRVCTAGLIILVAAGSWFAGRTNASGAFDDCITRGEAVRVSLARYRADHGEFPETLNRIALRDLPGQRWLRGPLLVYRRTLPDGYELRFSDWLVTHRATETEGFSARK